VVSVHMMMVAVRCAVTLTKAVLEKNLRGVFLIEYAPFFISIGKENHDESI
jgi:hypothetical protein